MTEKTLKQPDAGTLAALCVSSIENGKGENVISIRITDMTVIADYFVLCTGNSDPHIKALSERLKRDVSKELGVKPRLDGVPASSWIVMDYGSVIVHILSPEMREHYNLESLWSDNPDKSAIAAVSEMQSSAGVE